MGAAKQARLVAMATDEVPPSLAMWAGKAAPKRKGSRSWDRFRAQADVGRMIAVDDWSEATPKHFVELYVHLHRQIYGVDVLELGQAKVRASAASMAKRTLVDHFGGDGDALAAFMRWVWQRQAVEEAQRRAGARDGDFRVTWRYQWSPRLVTDYRRHEVAGRRQVVGR